MGVFIAGEDKDAVDVTGIRVMGFNPTAIDYIGYVIRQRLGDPNPNIIGDGVDAVKRRFKPPENLKEKIEARV